MTSPKQATIRFRHLDHAAEVQMEVRNPARAALSAWRSLTDEQLSGLDLADGDAVDVEVTYHVEVTRRAQFRVAMRPDLLQVGKFKRTPGSER